MRSPELTKLNDFAYKLPPTPRVGLVRPPSTALPRPALILLFAKKFFRSPRRTNEVDRTNILAPGLKCLCGIAPSSRLHPQNSSGTGPMGSRIQLQQRNCSRVSRDFLRRSTFPSSQRTGSRTTGLHSKRQDYLITCQLLLSCRALVETSLIGEDQRFLDFARNDKKRHASKLQVT